MSSGSSRGSPTPRFAVRATDRSSFGPAVIDTARALGIDPLPWQELVAHVALEHDDGQLAYRACAISTPRQSGKSTLVLPLIVHRLLAAPGQRVAYAAQSRLAARVKLFDAWCC